MISPFIQLVPGINPESDHFGIRGTDPSITDQLCWEDSARIKQTYIPLAGFEPFDTSVQIALRFLSFVYCKSLVTLCSAILIVHYASPLFPRFPRF
jgi:hypothetical protein